MLAELKSGDVYMNMKRGSGKWRLVSSMFYAKTQLRFVYSFTRSKGCREGPAGARCRSQFIKQARFRSLGLD